MFWQGCQKCIQRVQIITLSKIYFLKKEQQFLQLLSDLSSEELQIFCGKLLVRALQLHFTSPEEHLEKKYFRRKQTLFANHFWSLSGKLMFLPKKTMRDWQRCFLHVHGNFLRKSNVFEINYFFSKSFLDFESIIPRFLLNYIRQECPNCTLRVQENILKKVDVWRKLIFYRVRTVIKNFSFFWQKFPAGMSKLHSACPKELFEVFFEKNYLFSTFSDFEQRKPGLLQIFLARFVNTALYVSRRYKARKMIILFKKIMFFSHFQVFSEKLSEFWQKFLARLSLLKGSCLEEHFGDNFFIEYLILFFSLRY